MFGFSSCCNVASQHRRGLALFTRNVCDDGYVARSYILQQRQEIGDARLHQYAIRLAVIEPGWWNF
jgi:hypothetical protein